MRRRHDRVAGNIRRNAPACATFAAEDGSAAGAKKTSGSKTLRQLGIDIPDPRPRCGWANHTRVFHTPPLQRVVLRSVVKQFQTRRQARLHVRP